MFYKQVIEAAAQRRDLLRGGILTGVGDLSAIAQDRRDVLVDGQCPIGMARYPLLGPQFEAELKAQGLDPLLTIKATDDDIRTAWAIMLNLPISQSVRGACASSDNMRAHFGQVAGEDRKTWRILVSEFIRASPDHLLTWLSKVRAEHPATFKHLLSMDLVQALAENPDIEMSKWPSSVQSPPLIRPFYALACLCEFIRIAQTYRALLHWSFLELGRDLTADTVVKTIRASHRARTGLKVVNRLLENAHLQSLGFGHNVDDSVDGRTLLYRQGVLTLAADGAGVAGRPFVAPQNKASAADLASAMGTHSLYRTVGGTSRVPRKPAITYWGMTYRDFVGVMLLDLADAALSLEKGRARGKFDKPDRIRRAIVQVELTWLEQVSDLALAERLKQIVAGARGKSEEVPTPHCEDYSPAAVVDCLSAPAGQNFRTWKKKCEQLPEIGSEGSIIRSRPDLWWKGLGSDLDPFKRARAQAEASVELVRLEAPDQFLPTSHPRETRYRGALSDVLASQLVRSTTSMSHDRLPLVASADCALLLSPLSLDPQRSLFKTATRALTKP